MILVMISCMLLSLQVWISNDSNSSEAADQWRDTIANPEKVVVKWHNIGLAWWYRGRYFLVPIWTWAKRFLHLFKTNSHQIRQEENNACFELCTEKKRRHRVGEKLENPGIVLGIQKPLEKLSKYCGFYFPYGLHRKLLYIYAHCSFSSELMFF